MTENSVASGYARALFAIASETGIADEVEKELDAMDSMLAQNADLRGLMMHPGVPLQQKKRLVEGILAHGCSSLLKRFLFVVIDKRRVGLLTFLQDSYRSVIREVKGIVLAEVQTAVELTNEDSARLKAQLERLTGKDIEIATSINVDILGGVVVRLGDKLIDGSVRSRLLKMKKHLLQTVPV